jgi:hypothetical protein
MNRSNGAGTRLFLLTVQRRLCASLAHFNSATGRTLAAANCVLTPAERPKAALGPSGDTTTLYERLAL